MRESLTLDRIPTILFMSMRFISGHDWELSGRFASRSLRRVGSIFSASSAHRRNASLYDRYDRRRNPAAFDHVGPRGTLDVMSPFTPLGSFSETRSKVREKVFATPFIPRSVVFFCQPTQPQRASLSRDSYAFDTRGELWVLCSRLE